MIDNDRNDTIGLYAALLAGELEAGAAALASQQMLKLVTASIPQAVFWKDLDLNYLGCNQIFADMAGMSVEELIGNNDLRMSWGPHEAETYRRWDRHVIATNTPRFNIKEPIHRPDGEVRWLETNKVPIRDFDGQVVGVLGTFQDVTERIQAQRGLTKALADLDRRVSERTRALSAANEALKQEVTKRTRLQQLEGEQRAYAETLRDSAAAFTRSRDIEDVLSTVVQSLNRLIDLDVAAVFLVDDDGFASLAHSLVAGDAELDVDDPEGRRLAQAIHSEDHQFPFMFSPQEAPYIGARLGREADCLLIAPMEVAGRRIGYAVAERRRPGKFSTEDAKGISFVADQAAAAVTNVRLVKDASELAALNERQRLARDLHDAVSQTLWTASLTADALSSVDDPESREDQIARLQVLARGALAEMRNLLVELRPSAIEESDLPALITQLVAAFTSRKTVNVRHCIESVTGVSPAVKETIFRVVQEAINNISRHVSPTEVYVALIQHPESLEAVVKDNGGGFDTAAVRPGHFGLRIMEERAISVGGTLSVISNPDGTTVRVVIPRAGHV